MRYTFLLAMVIFVSCTSFPSKPAETSDNPIVIKTPSGKASITLSDDGTIRIRGKKVLIYSEGKLILDGSPLDLNPSVQKKPEKTSKKAESPKSSHTDKLFAELQALPVIGADSALFQNSMIMYNSTVGVDKVVEFYKRELDKRGWKASEINTDRQNYATMYFKKGNELLSISAGAGQDNATLVSITPLGSMDIKSVARYPGSETIFEETTQRIEVTPDAVAKVAAYLRPHFQKAGWQEKEDRHISGKDSETMTYIQNNTELSVYISVAPAQNNKTTIQCSMRRITGEEEE